MESASHRLAHRTQFYAELTRMRLGTYMTTYFLRVPQGQLEQPYSFLYTFPCSLGSISKNSGLSGRNKIKVKRRWCVLDARRFTYYKSRSKNVIKDLIKIDPGAVNLIMAPYCQPLPLSGIAIFLLAPCDT